MNLFQLSYNLIVLILKLARCVCGDRSLIRHHVAAPPPMDLVRVQSNLSLEDPNLNVKKIVGFLIFAGVTDDDK